MRGRLVEEDGVVCIRVISDGVVRNTLGRIVTSDEGRYWAFGSESAARRFAKRKKIQLEEPT